MHSQSIYLTGNSGVVKMWAVPWTAGYFNVGVNISPVGRNLLPYQNLNQNSRGRHREVPGLLASDTVWPSGVFAFKMA